MSRIEEILRGSVGQFWSIGSTRPLSEAPGYVRAGDDGRVEVELIDEQPLRAFGDGTGPEIPGALAGRLPGGTVLVTNITRASASLRLGGSAASVRSYRALGLVTNVGEASAIHSPHMRAVSAHFPGMVRWLGVQDEEPRAVYDSAGRVTEFHIALRSAPPIARVKAGGGKALIIEPTWETQRAAGSRTIKMGVVTRCEARTPQDIGDLFAPIEHFRNLLCLAWDGMVQVVPDSSDDGGSRHWWAPLMATQEGTGNGPNVEGAPLISFQQMGGRLAVQRWLGICEKFPRAVNPLVGAYRAGVSPELGLLQMGAAVEYWVSAHAGAAWAPRGTRGDDIPRAVWRHVGQSAKGVFHDERWWAARFWTEYNNLKHNPAHIADSRLVRALAVSARVLLTASVLNEAGLSKAPARRLLGDYRLRNGVGEEIRKLQVEQPLPSAATRRSRTAGSRTPNGASAPT